MIFLNVLLLLFAEVFANTSNPKPRSILSTEAFFIPISQEWFPKFKKDDPLEYSVSLLDMPDLPSWMYSHSTNSSNAFLYGSAAEPGDVKIEVVALNLNTYDTAVAVMDIDVKPRERVYQFEVEMKFLNLNVDDMFKSNRLSRLVDIFKTSLWKGSEDTYVTKVVSSLDAGGRLPLDPKMKEGVVVRIGGMVPFSRDLEDLEREVQPLRARQPCPRDYKRTSVEHLFRSRNFIADWCSFRLVSEKPPLRAGTSDGWSDRPHSSVSFSSDEYHPEVTQNLPRRDLSYDFVVTLLVPSCVAGLLIILFTFIIFCHRGREDKSMNGTSIQMEHLNSTPGQTKRLSSQRDESVQRSVSVPPLFPDSRADSPSSTLPKGVTLRASSRSGTLRSVIQPPPPPYPNTSYPPSYMGSTRNISATSQ